MKSKHFTLIALIISVGINIAILMAVFSLTADNISANKNETELPLLDAMKVLNIEENIDITSSGNIVSLNTINISSETVGKIIEGKCNLRPGEKFRKEDLLFQIDDTELRYSIRAKKSSFISSLLNMLPEIKTEFSSEFSKWNEYILSIKLNESLPTLPSWNNNEEKLFLSAKLILSEYFNIKALEEQLRKHLIFAPFSGIITKVYAPTFSFVNSGDKVIQITQKGIYEMQVPIATNQIHLIKIGSKCKLLSADGIEKGIGSIIRISEIIQNETQLVYVKPIAHKDQRFMEGEHLTVKMDQQISYTGTRIPLSAIHDNSVFVYSEKDSLVHKKQILILNENVNDAFVTGLQNTDTLILDAVLDSSCATKYRIRLK